MSFTVRFQVGGYRRVTLALESNTYETVIRVLFLEYVHLAGLSPEGNDQKRILPRRLQRRPRMGYMDIHMLPARQSDSLGRIEIRFGHLGELRLYQDRKNLLPCRR